AFTDGEAKRHACATLGTQSNAFSDWLEAQHECRHVSTNQSMLAGNTDDATAHAVKVNLNVVWDALMKSAYLQDNQEVAEFIVSLTGTVIYDAQGTPSYIPAMLVGNDTAINALLTGGDLEVYRCENTETCLSMSLSAIRLSESQAFNAKVRHTVDTLYAHLQSDQPITDSEKSFVELSDIPILAMLIDDAHLNLQPESHLYAQNIAADLLHAYLNNMLMIVNQSLTNLASVNPTDVNRTLEGINRARDYLQTLRDRHKTKLNAYLALTERLKRKRKLLSQSASDATLSNLTFGH
ncbi:conjugal transfer protein TraH, partial [Vibrio sp. 10N.222.54.A1]